MRFSTKIFLTIVGMTMLGVLLTSVSVYEVAKHLYQKEYTKLYQERLELVARNFISVEEESLQTSLNAAKLIRELEDKSLLDSNELKRLATELSVDGINIIDANGKTIQASDGRTHQNLYSLCSGYRELIDGKKEYQHVPLVPDVLESGVVAWFTLLPSKNSHHIIDIRNNFENFSQTLEQLTEDNSDIVHVTLKSPTGKILGDVKNPALMDQVTSTLTFTIAATVPDCCECRVRGFVSGDAPYSYEFVAGLTNLSLKKSIATLRTKFIWIVSILLFLSFILSLWLTKILLRKIKAIQSAVDSIAESGDFSKRIDVTDDSKHSQDELDLLARRFNRMFDGLQEAQTKLIEAEKSEARAAVGAQVAHDIKSPLTSMALALNQLQQIIPGAGAEMFSLLSHAVSRISGIVKRLGSQGAMESNTLVVEAPKLTLVDKLFFDVAQEHALKMPRSQKFNITGFNTVPEIWSVVQVTEVQTALSNILNNASEAMNNGGVIELSAHKKNDKEYVVTISDNGKGIAPENLNKILDRGISLEKAGGSGLGLYQAKRAVEWSGGTLSIESTIGVGTKIHMNLPIEKVPAFTTLEVLVRPNQKLIVTDDDPLIIATWKKKYPSALTFSSFSQLELALPDLGELADYIFVLDQYAGDGREGLTGIAFIEKYQIPAYLSTTEFDDPIIQEKVKALKAKLIPKPQLAGVSVKDQE